MFKKIIAIVLLMTMAFSFSACGEDELELTGLGNIYGLDPEIELRIIKTHYGVNYRGQESIDNQPVRHYYGTYNDCTVVVMPFGGWGMIPIMYEIVDDFLFMYYDVKIYAWKADKMYMLEQAFDEGVLTKEDLKDIYKRHKNLHLLCEAVHREYGFSGGKFSEYLIEDINRLGLNLYDREYIYKLFDLYKGEDVNE